jgi:hypothetical protein
MANFEHILSEEGILALGSNLAKVHAFAINKVLQNSCFPSEPMPL